MIVETEIGADSPMSAVLENFPARNGRCSGGITIGGCRVAGSARTRRSRRSARATAIWTWPSDGAHPVQHEQDAEGFDLAGGTRRIFCGRQIR